MYYLVEVSGHNLEVFRLEVSTLFTLQPVSNHFYSGGGGEGGLNLLIVVTLNNEEEL
jgi:hypothetical protein